MPIAQRPAILCSFNLSLNFKNEQEFDHDGDRVITRDELKVAMKNLGEVLSDEDIDSIMKEADHDGNGTIDFDEFKKIVLGH